MLELAGLFFEELPPGEVPILLSCLSLIPPVAETQIRESKMKSVKVLYTKENYSIRGDPVDHKMEKKVCDEQGNVKDRLEVDLSLDHYIIVGIHHFDNAWSHERIFRWILNAYNFGNYTSVIAEKIKSGDLNAGHASFSKGDIIQIDDSCYYMNNEKEFHMLPEELSDHPDTDRFDSKEGGWIKP